MTQTEKALNIALFAYESVLYGLERDIEEFLTDAVRAYNRAVR